MNKIEILWRTRLGHMLFIRMRDIPHIPCQFSSKQPFTYTICPLARQPKLFFPDSSIKASHPFQLIHVDTWDPYNSPTYNGCIFFFLPLLIISRELLGLILWYPRAMPFL